MMSTAAIPRPIPDLEFADLLGSFPEGDRLVGTRCASCGTVMIGSRVVCSTCVGEQVERISLSTTGTLYSFTRLHSRDGIRALGYVDLDGGVRTLATLHETAPLVPDQRVELGVGAGEWFFAPVEAAS